MHTAEDWNQGDNDGGDRTLTMTRLLGLIAFGVFIWTIIILTIVWLMS